VRFLVGAGEVCFRYAWQNEEKSKYIQIFVDSDWAGCKRSR
jgi:hypothetical protein